ncbi:MAG: hypothetical protein AAFP84_01730 [Actinomycetota bacterium]
MSHLPGRTITGNGHEFTIHRPDGATEVSRPPSQMAAPRHARAASDTAGGDPPGDSPPRADTIGREPSNDDVREAIQRTVRQLDLV